MRSELGQFLVTRRSRRPSPTVGRRRTPGLRREEVAAAAAVSVDYYTRLEQGRENNPSNAVLSALAGPLALDDDDLRYLRALRDRGTVPRPESSALFAPRMQELVAAVRPNPAYVLDRFSDVIAINPEGAELFSGLTDQAGSTANTCRYLLTDPRARSHFVDWEAVARRSVAALRAANADALDAPRLNSLVAELSEASDHFVRWWADQEVAPRRAAEKRFREPDGTVLVYPYEVLHLEDHRARMTIYLAGRRCG